MPNVISCVIIGKIRTVGNIFKVVFLAIAFNVTSRKFNQRSDYVPPFWRNCRQACQRRTPCNIEYQRFGIVGCRVSGCNFCTKFLRKLVKESVADISSAKLFADFLLFGKRGNINAFYEKFRVKFLTKNFAEIFITLCLITTDIVVDMSGINRKIVFFFQRNKNT